MLHTTPHWLSISEVAIKLWEWCAGWGGGVPLAEVPPTGWPLSLCALKRGEELAWGRGSCWEEEDCISSLSVGLRARQGWFPPRSAKSVSYLTGQVASRSAPPFPYWYNRDESTGSSSCENFNETLSREHWSSAGPHTQHVSLNLILCFSNY